MFKAKKEAVMIATTRPVMSVSEPTLYVAFGLGKNEWKLAMTSGFGVEPLVRTIAGRDLRAVERAVEDGRRRLGVPAGAPGDCLASPRRYQAYVTIRSTPSASLPLPPRLRG
jgi:hypothetical protein